MRPALRIRSLLVAAAALTVATACSRGTERPRESGIEFIHDDYAQALAQARDRGLPLVVDVWASWCHTCLSMQRYVLPDPALRPVRDRAVWLAVDSENPVNKRFLERFPLDAWPTFLVIDPATESVAARWAGAASTDDFRRFVEAGARDVAESAASGTAVADLRRGFEARARGDFAAAGEAYAQALAKTAAEDPARPPRLVLLAMALARQRTPEAARRCVGLGLAELEATGNSSVATDFIAVVRGCAARLDANDPEGGELRKRAARRPAALVADLAAPLAVDDRSDAYANLIELFDDAGQHADALAYARARARMLEEAAARAGDPTRASTFDAHRVEVYLYLGEPGKAESLLAEREREMPADYNPAARLARVLFEQKKLAPAEAAVDRALAKMTRGQRRLGVLALKGRILEAQGKATEALLREQLEVARELPATQRNPTLEAELEAKLLRPAAAPGP